jgi:hypothetical protein
MRVLRSFFVNLMHVIFTIYYKDTIRRKMITLLNCDYSESCKFVFHDLIHALIHLQFTLTTFSFGFAN